MAIRTGLGTTTSDQKSAGSFAQNPKTPPKIKTQSSAPFGISSKDKVVEVHRGPPATEREQVPTPPKRVGFSLNEFSSHIASYSGLYKQSLYLVEIEPGPGATWVTEGKIGDTQKLSMFCNSASLPGAQILSSDHRRMGYGPFDRRPFGIQVTDIPLTFFVDNKGYILKLFNNWFNNIINYDFRAGEHGSSPTKQQLFEVNYRANYLSTVLIHTFDHTANEIITYILHEAFPIQMGDVTVAWSENDSFSVIPVQFTFRTYNTDRQQHPTLTQSSFELTEAAMAKVNADPSIARILGNSKPRSTIASLGNI